MYMGLTWPYVLKDPGVWHDTGWTMARDVWDFWNTGGTMVTGLPTWCDGSWTMCKELSPVWFDSGWTMITDLWACYGNDWPMSKELWVQYHLTVVEPWLQIYEPDVTMAKPYLKNCESNMIHAEQRFEICKLDLTYNGWTIVTDLWAWCDHG